MESIEAFLARFPQLTAEHKLEIINYQWLFTNAPESARARAIARLDSLLEQTDVDAQTIMKTMRDVTVDLQGAIADRIAKMRLVSSSG